MFPSFTTALGGLNANADGLDVVSNNLANLNTPGFKRSVAQFHDFMADAFRLNQQGSVQSSGGSLDAAIKGDGFFVARDAAGRLLLTRAGNFRTAADGTLLTATGEKVQGWTATNGVVDIAGAIGDITVPVGSLLPPTVSTNFSADLNLNSAAEAGTTYRVPITVVDSLGTSHLLTITLARGTAAGTWSYDITIPGADVGSTEATVSVASGPDAIVFDANGVMTSPAADVTGIQIAGLASGAADLSLTWELLNADGSRRLTQYAAPSATSAITTDGTPAAELVGIEMSDGGKIVATYSGGQQRTVAQLALATVRNPDSLTDVGGNCYTPSSETSTPVFGLPETGGRGKILAQALEASTVDIAQEFTNLILMQRGYQANSRVIVTTDELTQETINLKR
jgi:flagellar hook protein FlgE